MARRSCEMKLSLHRLRKRGIGWLRTPTPEAAPISGTAAPIGISPTRKILFFQGDEGDCGKPAMAVTKALMLERIGLGTPGHLQSESACRLGGAECLRNGLGNGDRRRLSRADARIHVCWIQPDGSQLMEG